MLGFEGSHSSYSNRGLLLSELDLLSEAWLVQCEKDQAHNSMFAFDYDELKEFLDQNSYMSKRFNGNVYMKTIILDFDGAAVDISQTLVEVRNYVRYIMSYLDVPEEYLKVWFSGYKGFHVELDGRLFGIAPSTALPEIMKATIYENMNHPLIDMSPVNTAGLIRAPYSKHKNGTYKTLIPLSELFSQKAPAIGVLTGMEARIISLEWPEEEPEPVLRRIVAMPKLTRRNSENTTVSAHDPTKLVTCMQLLISQGPKQGRRHQDILRLSSWLWRSGLPKEYAIKALSNWLPEEELERIVSNTYEKGYTYGCKDQVMQEYCSASCIFNKKKDYSMYVQSHDELAKNLANYISLIDQGKGFNLYSLYESQTTKEYRILPSSLTLVMADTGIGKSLFVQDMLVKMRKRTLYLNLEMPEALVTRRFIQSANSMTKGEVEDAIRSGQVLELASKLDWLKMVSDAPTLEAIERACMQYKPEFVVVDTTDGISVPEAGNNEMWHLRVIIEGLRKIAQSTNTTVFAIHHINKSGSRAISGEDFAETARSISLNDATGNRSNVTKMDHVIAIEGERTSYMRRIKTIKNRDGEPMEINVKFDFPKMQVVSNAASKEASF
jgi:archaellum biogenesis ATPase FlaH